MSLVQEAQASLAKADGNGNGNAGRDADTAAAAPTGPNPMRDGGRVPSGIDPMSTFPDPGPSPSPPPRPTPAPAQLSRQSRLGLGLGLGLEAVPGSRERAGYLGSTDEAKGGGGVSAEAVEGGEGYEVEVEVEVGRLVEWRDELLATGMYTPQNPIVSELNRRIASSTGRVRGDARPLQREE